MYEAKEAKQKARGLKFCVAKCNSLGVPNESGRYSFKFLKVFRALYIISLICIGTRV